MRVLTVDLGATSVRIASVDLHADTSEPRVIHRWAHGPVLHGDGSLRWDWDGIVREVHRGLALALAEGPAASIGVDGWGVDYGLVDADGRLLSPPFSYRDARTQRWRDTASSIGEESLYTRTGIQLMPINTIFQLASHDRGELAAAESMLLLPDLLVHGLTGHLGAERTVASTTGLLEVGTGGWSLELIEAVGVPRTLLCDLHDAPLHVGMYQGVPVHLVGSHDTASAFIGVPGIPGPGTAIIATGTWALVGAERAVPDTSTVARAANFSNERGALGGFRFLTNVMGLWLLERCREKWGAPPLEELLAEAEAVDEPIPAVALKDTRFVAADDAVAELLKASGIGDAAPRALVARCVLDSISQGISDAINDLASLSGSPISEVFHIGGGARIDLLNHLLAARTGLPVTVGSAEATCLGNALVQGLALGAFADLDEARTWSARSSVTCD